MRRHGLTLTDAHQVLVPARVHKLPIEIDFMREVMRRTELAVAEMEQVLVPGATEAEVWATFHRGLIAREGEYTAGRLFQSGPRTYPYFQECSDRPLAAGDLVCLDTDTVGVEGYCADFSRAFLCGDGIATEAQRSLYAKAREQLEWNAALLKPGVTFEEIARQAWPIPPEHRASATTASATDSASLETSRTSRTCATRNRTRCRARSSRAWCSASRATSGRRPSARE